MVPFHDLSVPSGWRPYGCVQPETAELLTKHSTSSGNTDELNKINSKLRRFAHVFVFFVLTVLCGIAFDSWYWIVAVCFWAWADEATKPWIEGRHFSWYDVGLNLIGVMAGVLLLALWKIKDLL